MNPTTVVEIAQVERGNDRAGWLCWVVAAGVVTRLCHWDFNPGLTVQQNRELLEAKLFSNRGKEVR